MVKGLDLHVAIAKGLNDVYGWGARMRCMDEEYEIGTEIRCMDDAEDSNIEVVYYYTNTSCKIEEGKRKNERENSQLQG
jgi:hypothetical protein